VLQFEKVVFKLKNQLLGQKKREAYHFLPQTNTPMTRFLSIQDRIS